MRPAPGGRPGEDARQPMTTLQRLKHEARRAEQRSDWRRAIALYRDALRFDEQTGASADLSLWNRIGDLHMRLGEVPAAVQCYEQAADRYADHDLPTSAIAICNKILRIDPGRDVVYRRLGLLHAVTGLAAEGRTACLQFVEKALARGATAEALEAVQEFVDRTGDERIRLKAAEILESAGRADEGRAQRRLAGTEPERSASAEPERPAGAPVVSPRAPAVRPEEPLDRRLRGRLGLDSSADADAVDGSAAATGGRSGPEEASLGSPPPPEVQAAIGELRSRLSGLLEEAGPEVRYDLGVAFQAMGLAEEAARELRHGIAAPGRLRSAHGRLAGLFESAPARSSAVDAASVPAEPEPERATARSGDAGARDGDPTDIQGHFCQARLARYQVRQAEGRHQTDHRAHLDLGAAYAALGLADEAVRELAVALEGSRPVADRAIEVLAEIAGDEETEPALAFAIGHLLADAGHGPPPPGAPPAPPLASTPDPGSAVAAGRTPSARPAVHAGSESPSGSRAADLASVDDLLADGRADEAAALLYAALERHEEERRFDRALVVVDRLLDLRPDDVILHHQKAELAMMIEDRPALVSAWSDLAASLLRQGAPRAARTVYERLLEVDPGDAGAREALDRLAAGARAPGSGRPSSEPADADSGRAVPGRRDGPWPGGAAEAGEFDQLFDDLRESLPGPPGLDDDPEAHFELGIAFKQMEMWQEALAELERSIAGLADPRPAHEAAGECLVRLGRHGPALAVLEEADSLFPEGEERSRLGVLYWRAEALAGLGRHDEARGLLARIVSTDPDFRDSARRLSALSR